MRNFILSLLVLFSTQTFAGAPLLNCAIPLDVAEVARQFGSYEHCLRYYMLRSGCDARCIPHYETLCHTATDQACPQLNLPRPVADQTDVFIGTPESQPLY